MKDINELNALLEGLGTTIGMEITEWQEDMLRATMVVDGSNSQLYGIMNGGAALALAETLAGVGSHLLCEEGEITVGIEVNGNHLNMARVGETVTATATLLHRGHRQHVWNVDIRNEEDKLVSTERVVNMIIKKSR
ncbi:MAG: PaaI family thioesterase [Bacteroidaceae bacterium]|nr:PaaI family thioesterase [Bacteroidaceae bacterium]